MKRQIEGLGNPVDELPELESQTDALLAFQTQRGIFVREIVFYPVNGETQFDGKEAMADQRRKSP
jgi:hypothetical protein